MQTSPPRRMNLQCGDVTIETARRSLQEHWYKWAAGSCHGLTVLDVGCGLGEGVKILQQTARDVIGQDIDNNLDCLHTQIETLPDKCFDVVTCFDVIEHVIEDLSFFNDLKRIARKKLFVSTPNHKISNCTNLYHCREYIMEEFIEYFAPDELWVLGGKIRQAIQSDDKTAQSFCGVWNLCQE